jgi:hypothetical protein
MEKNPNSPLQIYEEDKAYLLRFRRVLVRPDQWIIDELLSYAEKHIYSVAHSKHALPFVMSLVAMVVEQHKRIKKLEEALSVLHERVL